MNYLSVQGSELKALARMEEIYELLINEVEKNFFEKGIRDALLCAFWLHDDGSLADVAINRRTDATKEKIGNVLDHLMEEGLPGGPKAPITISAAAMFAVDKKKGSGIYVMMRSNQFDVDQFSGVDPLTNRVAVTALDAERIYLRAMSSSALH